MASNTDTVFTGAIAEEFDREIYGTTKGEVRLHVLWEDLLAEVPALQAGGLRVIDVGAGAGQLARRVAELGHEVTLCEPSPDMLAKARALMDEARLSGKVHFVQASAQDARARVEGDFDLVLCHAVLEWVARPRDAVAATVPLMTPDGYLSLMFYNRNAAILKRVLRGDFTGALADSPEASPTGPAPLDPARVRGWLARAGLRVQSKSGIRIFHDHLPDSLRAGESLDALLQVETAFRKREPFASLAQHIHYVCRRR
jgi:S-adenosylmethionine-dependent methyltransferase